MYLLMEDSSLLKAGRVRIQDKNYLVNLCLIVL